MRSLFVGCVAIALGIGVAGEARADKCTDPTAVAAARAAVDAECPCDSFTNHGQYQRCARQVVNALAKAGELPNNCRSEVTRCASRSTCGRPEGFVTCCVTNRNGTTRCTIRRNAGACRAPSGGSACVGLFSSCCDACTSDGCAGGPTPTPSPTPTPTAEPTDTPTPTPTAEPTDTPTPTPSPTPPYGSASRAFVKPVASLLQ